MKDLINYIVEGKYTEADNELSSVMPDILKVKLFEMKKMVAAKMSVGEMHMNDFSENGADDQKQLPTKSKITKADKIKEQFRAAFSGMGSRQEKLKRDITEEDLEESDLPITTQKQKTDTYRHKKSGREIVATKHPGDEYEKLEEETINELSDENEEQLDEASLGGKKYKGQDNPNNKRSKGPGVDKRAQKAFDYHIDNASKQSSRLSAAVKRHSEGQSSKENKKIYDSARHQNKRHLQAAKAATKVGNVDISKASIMTQAWLKNRFGLDEESEEQLDEAPRVKIVKARIRGGVVQRRKKVATVPGMTIRGGQLKRMSPIERRNRKLGARKGKIKRKSKMARALIKRARSLRRRSAIGL